jgi:hypothetical protein
MEQPTPGTSYYDDEHIRFLSAYKVAICLENCVEPYYFTEKFINAVRAACIPVYHAHATVKTPFSLVPHGSIPLSSGFRRAAL